MIDRVQPPQPVSSTNQTADQQPEQPPSADRMAKFRSAMIAAALRQPMVSLGGANGEPEDEHDPAPIPMKAPVLVPPSKT